MHFNNFLVKQRGKRVPKEIRERSEEVRRIGEETPIHRVRSEERRRADSRCRRAAEGAESKRNY